MSVLDTPSPMIAKMAIRKHRLRGYHNGQRVCSKVCSEIVQCMDGDVANLNDIEGIDFTVVNQDLVEYVANTF